MPRGYMKIIIMCEYSGQVRRAMRKLGYEAYSCDIRKSLDGSPFHLQCRAEEILYDGWDLMIAHPPCKHLAISGAQWFKDKGELQEKALKFVRLLMNAPIKRKAIENPISVISTKIRPPDQRIQPFWFGDPIKKTTCLWLENLPKLVPTNMVPVTGEVYYGSKSNIPKWYNKKSERDITFPGIAQAIASQWGGLG